MSTDVHFRLYFCAKVVKKFLLFDFLALLIILGWGLLKLEHEPFLFFKKRTLSSSLSEHLSDNPADVKYSFRYCKWV